MSAAIPERWRRFRRSSRAARKSSAGLRIGTVSDPIELAGENEYAVSGKGPPRLLSCSLPQGLDAGRIPLIDEAPSVVDPRGRLDADHFAGVLDERREQGVETGRVR